MPNLVVILGDQLSHNVSSLQNASKKSDIILMCEVLNECTIPKHHKKKIVFVLSTMRHFAEELKQEGYNVYYVKLEDKLNTQSFKSEIIRNYNKYQCSKITVTEPSEFRVLEDLKQIPNIQIIPDDRFLCSTEEFKKFFHNKKGFLMESFYRYMRVKHNILMEQNKPIGGMWNYDKENRKQPIKNLKFSDNICFKKDDITTEVIATVEKKFADHFGDIDPFKLAVTRGDALKALEYFVANKLALFGDFQDAMLESEDFLYHSYISSYINIGLLNPLEVIKAVELAYHKKTASLNSVEGFIRQILGWREYIRGIYWTQMPSYKNLNFFKATRSLPQFYWDGKTEMNCIKNCIKNTKQNAYAHHIQRLMVLGNLALIAGFSPSEVSEWYHIVYSDAYEWVEMPNVLGMALFADGGVVGSKPYASSGAYINKMSDYCKNCKYHVKEKTTQNACPFNYLYWNFLIENRDQLSQNHRMQMMYSMLDKFDKKLTHKMQLMANNFLK